jgi:RHS repeat-associated protein
LQQVVNGDPSSYTLDLNTGLTQVLADGANKYLYGNGRIGEEQAGGWQYHMPDALGSVRQVTNNDGLVTMLQSYDPFGKELSGVGRAASAFQFAGEQHDKTGLIYLRRRYYSPDLGIIITRDPLIQYSKLNIMQTGYDYASQNPVNFVDPTGMFSRKQITNSFGRESWLELLFAAIKGADSRILGGQRSDKKISPALNDPEALQGGRWGFLALLLDAQPGDLLSYGCADITLTEPGLTRAGYGLIGFDEQRETITINGQSLSNFVINTLNRSGITPHHLSWRETTARYYALHRRLGLPLKRYIDGSAQTDLPDFHSLGTGIVLDGAYLVDRFGNRYIVVGLSAGVGAAIQYTEGYVSKSSLYSKQIGSRQLLSEDSLKNIIDGACLEVAAGVVQGRGAGFCFDSGYSYLIYSSTLGVTAGVGTSAIVIPLGKDISASWNWAIEDRLQGIMLSDLLDWHEIPYTGCGEYPY